MKKGGLSWKRAIGVTKLKRNISRKTGIPLTKSGRRRKLGKVTGGCVLYPGIFMFAIFFIFLISCGTSNEISKQIINTTTTKIEEATTTEKIETTTTAKVTTTTQEQTTTTEYESYSIGEDLLISENGEKIGRFIIRKIENYTSTNKYAKPDEGMRWIAIDVEEQNLSNEAQSYNSLNYALGDADGYRYDKDRSGGKEPSLDSGDLAPNNKIRGWVTIEVPKDLVIVEIYASPLYISPPIIIKVNPPLGPDN